MTLKQLNALRKGLNALRNEIKEITIKADSIPGGQSNGMPSAKGVSNSKENQYQIYLNEKAKLDKRYAKMLKEYSETFKYIDGIKDHTTYLIFYYRFINNFSWVKGAKTIGNNTEDSVKKTVYRYIERN